MRLLHFSDIHFWNFGLDADPTFKRALGVANLVARRARAFPPALAEAVLARIAASEADLVCFTGDISTSALRREFQRGRDALAAIAAKWGPRFLAVPGNHDRYTPRAARRSYYERHFSSHLAPHVAPDPAAYPFLTTIDGLDFVGIDTTRPCLWTSRGTFPPERAAALQRLLATQAESGRPCVLLSHYPYALPGERRHRWQHRLKEGPALADIVARFAPALVLHGHVHHRWAHRPAATPDTLCVNAGSAGMRSSQLDRNAGYVTIDLDAASGAVEAVHAIVLEPGSRTEFREFPIWPVAQVPVPERGRRPSVWARRPAS